MPILVHNVQAVRLGLNRQLSITSTATTATGTFDAQWVRLCPNIGVRFTIGTGATAALTDPYLAAGVVEYHKIISGHNVSAIGATATALSGEVGKLDVTEVTE